MSEKKMNATTRIRVLIMLILLGICIGAAVILTTNSNHTSIPFPYTQANDIDPNTLTKEIMQAIGYPNATPILTEKDRFLVLLYSNSHQKEAQMGFHSLASTFRINIEEKNSTRILTYELQLSRNGNLDIIYSNEIQSDEQTLNIFTLNELFSAIRDFPVTAYRELTEYGHRSADLYQIRLNDGPLLGENFSYNEHGPVQNDKNKNGIPFVITNMMWGKILDDSLDVDDPYRYQSIGGEDGINLIYHPSN